MAGQRVAIFGGTFDPIHCAHLEVARTAANRFHLDRVLFVPAATPPHKSGLTYAPYEDRVQMALLACDAEPRFQVSRLEESPERSYSIYTIEKVRADLDVQDELFFIIGADAFAELQTWHRWQDVIKRVRFIVVSRPGHTYQVTPGAALDRLDCLGLPVSSSDIRGELAAGKRPKALPAGVFEYIAAKGLYGAAVTA